MKKDRRCVRWLTLTVMLMLLFGLLAGCSHRMETSETARESTETSEIQGSEEETRMEEVTSEESASEVDSVMRRNDSLYRENAGYEVFAEYEEGAYPLITDDRLSVDVIRCYRDMDGVWYVDLLLKNDSEDNLAIYSRGASMNRIMLPDASFYVQLPAESENLTTWTLSGTKELGILEPERLDIELEAIDSGDVLAEEYNSGVVSYIPSEQPMNESEESAEYISETLPEYTETAPVLKEEEQEESEAFEDISEEGREDDKSEETEEDGSLILAKRKLSITALNAETTEETCTISLCIRNISGYNITLDSNEFLTEDGQTLDVVLTGVIFDQSTLYTQIVIRRDDSALQSLVVVPGSVFPENPAENAGDTGAEEDGGTEWNPGTIAFSMTAYVLESYEEGRIAFLCRDLEIPASFFE